MQLGFKGDTYAVGCDVGGWNANPNIDLVPATDMIYVENLNLHRGGRETRGGVGVVNSTIVSGAVQINGGYQFRKKSGSEFIITGTADGKIQKDYNTELKTGLGTDKYYMFETFSDNLYICNGYDIPQKWDGSASTTSNMASIPTDWTSTNQPKAIVKHGKGASESLWAFGVPTKPETVYISKNGTDDFTDANSTLIPIETGDGIGIVAACEFGDNLFCFGKKNTYVIDDTSTTRSEWGYVLAPWEGGAAHERLVCRTPNDLVVMAEDGDIYSIKAVESYGDYKAASLVRPFYINKWIDDNVDLAQIDKFHMVYDPVLRAIKIFVVRKDQTQVDTALVLFVDKGIWSRHKYASSNFASCSFPVRVSTGVWKVYVGGYNGYVYQLETNTFDDDGVYYYNGYYTPFLTFDNARLNKLYEHGWLVIVPQGSETIKIKINVDGLPITTGDNLEDENGNHIIYVEI